MGNNVIGAAQHRLNGGSNNKRLLSVHSAKMDETIASLLNVSNAADKTKLNALIIEYLE